MARPDHLLFFARIHMGKHIFEHSDRNFLFARGVAWQDAEYTQATFRTPLDLLTFRRGTKS